MIPAGTTMFNSKPVKMRKRPILFMILLFNVSLISCTEESLSEVIMEPEESYATGNEGEEPAPEEEPPNTGD